MATKSTTNIAKAASGSQRGGSSNPAVTSHTSVDSSRPAPANASSGSLGAGAADTTAAQQPSAATAGTTSGTTTNTTAVPNTPVASSRANRRRKDRNSEGVHRVTFTFTTAMAVPTG